MGSVGSAEANNWGMDDSIDVNAVRRDEDQTGCVKYDPCFFSTPLLYPPRTNPKPSPIEFLWLERLTSADPQIPHTTS